MERYDVVVIGAGIVGLAHARAAARRGARVLVIERASRALGASVRNFGMVWPIGQPPGPLLHRALRSRAIWLECAGGGGFAVEECGALHVAMHTDEMDVLTEFHERYAEAGYASALMTGAEALRMARGLRAGRILGALRTGMELCVDPREAIGALPRVLGKLGVEFRFGAHVRAVETGSVELSDGSRVEASCVIVCAGAELRTLFPRELAGAGLVGCKLQMMRTSPQPGGWRIGTHLAAGLTLIHYKAFAACGSLGAVRARLMDRYSRHIEAGVHVLVSQNASGELTLGDSHEYAPDADPFDKHAIDRMVLDYLDEFFECPSPGIAERWHGVYAKSATGASEFVLRAATGVHLVTGLGGNGMTLAFGLAEETIDDILADRPWHAPGE